MLFDPRQVKHVDRLEDELRHAQAISPGLFEDVIKDACPRFAACGALAQARVRRLIAAAAWLDATLALCEVEVPQWKLRRTVYEDGEWFCSLSRQPALPLGLDDAVDANHAILPLAILMALLQARRVAATSAVHSTSVPQIRTVLGGSACCDNFS